MPVSTRLFYFKNLDQKSRPSFFRFIESPLLAYRGFEKQSLAARQSVGEKCIPHQQPGAYRAAYRVKVAARPVRLCSYLAHAGCGLRCSLDSSGRPSPPLGRRSVSN
jgi:hypothetical protein